ncbi:hypothetical protein ACEUZ9_004683 [Paracoccus litorisediminis]|uniref:hypothetical protein n=1 Tax=Paracoccus litorisediminis TaxID=2006130 RepID=UPI003732028E
MRKFGFLVGASALSISIGTTALAEGNVLSAIGAKPVGVLDGQTVYAMPSQSMIWMKLPGGGVIGGYAFDADGNDISSDLTHSTPVSVWDSLRISRPAAEILIGAAPSAVPITPPAALAERAAPVQPMLPGTLGADPVAQPALPAQQGKATPQAAVAGAGSDAETLVNTTLAMANSTLQGMDQAQRDVLTLELVNTIKEAANPIDFRLRIIEWSEKAKGEQLLDDVVRARMRAESEALSAMIMSQTAPTSSQVIPAAPGVDSMALPAITVAPPAKEAPVVQILDGLDIDLKAGPAEDGRIFMNEIETRTGWVEIGDPTAPMAYMFADPMCPYCARSFQNLKGEIEGGKLRLRVILAPLISSRSGDMIAAIISAENPGEALWRHEMRYAETGASELAPVDFASLPQDKSDMIRGNYDLILQRGLKGVPFFAWEGAENPKFLSGVPEAGYFSGKIVPK